MPQGSSTAGRCRAHLAAAGRLLAAPAAALVAAVPAAPAEGLAAAAGCSSAAASSMADAPCRTSKCRCFPSSSLQSKGRQTQLLCQPRRGNSYVNQEGSTRRPAWQLSQRAGACPAPACTTGQGSVQHARPTAQQTSGSAMAAPRCGSGQGSAVHATLTRPRQPAPPSRRTMRT